MMFVRSLREIGKERFVVAKIAERGAFLPKTGMNQKKFNRVRKAINKNSVLLLK